jgi:hypothetical protein
VKTKERRHPKDIHQQFTLLFGITGNSIGATGSTSLSESLKSNTTLTKLNLSSEDKRRQKRYPSTTHSFSFLLISTDNRIGETGATTLSESLKSNTTLTKLNLSCEDKRKKTSKSHPSTIHSFPFSSHQQGTILETQDQNH